jgi:hypothetical protein
MKMLRTVFAMTVATLAFAAVSGTSQAAPIAPLPAGVTSGDVGSVTPVYYYHRGYYHRHWRHCRYRRCW